MAKNNIPESQTINQLGSGTVIKGDVKSNGDFRIDGTLIGTIESKGKIVIGTSGNVEGKITCQNAVISGSIKVKINVAELLELKSSSKFSGEIITNKLAIEPGAKFSGTCNMSDPGLKEIKPLVKNDPIKEKST
jgi:cytoskeletal protein CcmA (bactofilin family)